MRFLSILMILMFVPATAQAAGKVRVVRPRPVSKMPVVDGCKDGKCHLKKTKVTLE